MSTRQTSKFVSHCARGHPLPAYADEHLIILNTLSYHYTLPTKAISTPAFRTLHPVTVACRVPLGFAEPRSHATH